MLFKETTFYFYVSPYIETLVSLKAENYAMTTRWDNQGRLKLDPCDIIDLYI